jgi:hypothetical protein
MAGSEQDSFSFIVVKSTCQFNGPVYGLTYLGGKDTIEIIGCESACRKKKKKGGNHDQSHKDNDELCSEFISRDLIVHVHEQPVKIFPDEKDECQQRSDIEGEKASEQNTGCYIKARQFNEMNLYRSNEDDTKNQ